MSRVSRQVSLKRLGWREHALDLLNLAVAGRANHRELLLGAAAEEGEGLLQLRAMEEAAEAEEAAWQDTGESLARWLRCRGLCCAEAWVEVQISVCSSAGSQAPRDVNAAAASASLNTDI